MEVMKAKAAMKVKTDLVIVMKAKVVIDLIIIMKIKITLIVKVKKTKKK